MSGLDFGSMVGSTEVQYFERMFRAASEDQDPKLSAAVMRNTDPGDRRQGSWGWTAYALVCQLELSFQADCHTASATKNCQVQVRQTRHSGFKAVTLYRDSVSPKMRLSLTWPPAMRQACQLRCVFCCGFDSNAPSPVSTKDISNEQSAISPAGLQGGRVDDTDAGRPLAGVAFRRPQLLFQGRSLLVKLDALQEHRQQTLVKAVLTSDRLA